MDSKDTITRLVLILSFNAGRCIFKVLFASAGTRPSHTIFVVLFRFAPIERLAMCAQSRDPLSPRVCASNRSNPSSPWKKLPRVSANFEQWESSNHSTPRALSGSTSDDESPSTPVSIFSASSDEPPPYALACHSDLVGADIVGAPGLLSSFSIWASSPRWILQQWPW